MVDVGLTGITRSPRKTTLMQKVLAGFALGYLLIAFLAVPTTLWAFEVTPSYAGGVVMVLDRSGVLAPVQSQVVQAVATRIRLLHQLGDYIDSKLFMSRAPAE
jgi:hypothetical protein